MQESFWIYPLCALLSGVFTAVFLRFLIPILKSKRMGQKILDIGPRWHKDKEGTPTMGGIAFISVFFILSTAVFIFFIKGTDRQYAFIASAIYSVLCGFIGVSDDICKLKKSRNEGLSATQKYLLQLSASALFLIALKRIGAVSEQVYIPFANKFIDLGWFYYPFMLLFMSGFNNAVNLTDGADGLCASVTSAVAVGFFAIGVRTENISVGTFSALLFGAMLGFLVYNLNPAKVFMGDTGSLFLGGAVTSLAILCASPLLLLLMGAIYVLEALSVIIQVVYFKLSSGKRFFKMAPFHHHLERCGWSENKIMLVFTLVTLLLCIPAVLA